MRSVFSILALWLALAAPPVHAREPAEIALLPKGIEGLHDRLHMLRKCRSGDAFYFTTYWMSQDSLARALMYEFVQAAKRGCAVRGIVDPFHERLPTRYHSYMIANGVDLREFRPMSIGDFLRRGFSYINNRIHDKLWVLDPGGGWRDMGIPRTLESSLPARSPWHEPEMITGSSNLLGESFRLNTASGPTGHRNDVDLDFVARGRAVDEVIRYHHYIWEQGNVLPRRVQIPRPLLRRTARWVEKGHRELLAALSLTDEKIAKKPQRIFRKAIITFFHDRIARNLNAPEGSEQAIFEAIQRARRGDWVKLDDRSVLYTPELYERLEKAKLGDMVEIDGAPIRYTQAVRDALAAATPADDILISNQYFILTRELEVELRVARAQGVRIRVTTNGAENEAAGWVTRQGYRYTFQRAVDAGVEIFEHTGPDNLHAKVIVRRNVKLGWIESTVGTSNLDPRSLNVRPPAAEGSPRRIPMLRNLEVNFRIEESPELAEDIGRRVEAQLAFSQRVAANGKALIPRPCHLLYRLILGRKSIFDML